MMQKFSLCFFLLLGSALFAQQPPYEAEISALIDKGAYAQAFNKLEAFKNIAPASAFSLSARLHYDMGSYSEALTNINSAILLAPRNATNFLILGNILRKMGSADEARSAYNRGIEQDSSYGQFYFELAQLAFLEQKAVEAERGLKLSQNFNPNSWMNEVLAAKLLLNQGRTNEAERRFLAAAAAYPQEAPILQELGDFYAAQKKFEKAFAALKEAEVRFGENAARSLQLGDYAFLRGAQNEAQTYYQKALSFFGNKPFSGSALVHWRLYQLASQRGQTNIAESNLRAAFEQNPANELYISAFSHFLAQKYPPNNSYRDVMGNFLARYGQRERRSGYGSYYLSIIYKQALVDPFNPAPYRELLNYSKINQNESAVPALLKSLQRALPEDTNISTTLRIRDHLAATGRLNQKPRKLYAYKTVFFIEDSVYQSANAFGQELVFYNPLFPKLDISLSPRSFAEESRSLFREGRTGIAALVQVRQGFLTLQLFDNKGALISSESLSYNPENFTKNILTLLTKFSSRLAPVGYIDQRLPNNVYRTSIGAQDGITAEEQLSVYEPKNFSPVARLSVVETQPYAATAFLLNEGTPVSLGTGAGYYVAPAVLEERIDPSRIFLPEGSPTLNLDPFDRINSSIENLRLP